MAMNERCDVLAPSLISSPMTLYIHVIFSWTQIGRFGFTDREIGSQIGIFFAAKNIQT